MYASAPKGEMTQFIALAEDQHFIREELERLELAAFVADGSILPRESGVSDRPMKGAVPFQSPKKLAVTLELPHRGTVRWMGIRRGITLIAGGGYHGKSTLLKALERATNLWQKAGVSLILVVGSCGAHFHLADNVVQMDAYHARDITDQAKAALMKLMEEKGLGAVCGGGVVPAGLTMPRMQEIFACFDRY